MLGEKLAHAIVSATSTYCRTYQCSVTRHSGSYIPSSGISIMEFVMKITRAKSNPGPTQWTFFSLPLIRAYFLINTQTSIMILLLTKLSFCFFMNFKTAIVVVNEGTHADIFPHSRPLFFFFKSGDFLNAVLKMKGNKLE